MEKIADNFGWSLVCVIAACGIALSVRITHYWMARLLDSIHAIGKPEPAKQEEKSKHQFPDDSYDY